MEFERWRLRIWIAAAAAAVALCYNAQRVHHVALVVLLLPCLGRLAARSRPWVDNDWGEVEHLRLVACRRRATGDLVAVRKREHELVGVAIAFEDCKGGADIAVAEIITPLAPPLRDTCPSRALQSPVELSDSANGVRL